MKLRRSDYFDVRYYPKAGTFHVFSRRKDLVERMNRVVGEQRKWLPHDKAAAPAAFWQQYDSAEKVTAKIPNLQALEWEASRRWSDEAQERAQRALYLAHQKALGDLGIVYHPSMLLEHERARQAERPLLPAPRSELDAA